ncbi:MAG: hypothetical protein A2075_00395 [Geobacteraceae bacterium GWC2_58_44]|nr:MAG: hypothetical protein A2075_00395 [Geobacteraceae bacterium GWC2_58_44]HBG07101.1 hypothetical protein [Geobacter sp.]
MKIIARIMFVSALLFSSAHSAEAIQTLNEFEVGDQAKWSCAKSIAVTLFPAAGEFKADKDLQHYQVDFAKKLASGLKKMPGVEQVEIVDDKSAASADVLILGQFTELTKGNGALRFWVGLGAGKSSCGVDMKGVDLKSESEIFRLDHARRSAMEVVGDDVLIKNMDEVVEDVIAGLAAAKGACGSGPAPENSTGAN